MNISDRIFYGILTGTVIVIAGAVVYILFLLAAAFIKVVLEI